jgi:hypothetical protein
MVIRVESRRLFALRDGDPVPASLVGVRRKGVPGTHCSPSETVRLQPQSSLGGGIAGADFDQQLSQSPHAERFEVFRIKGRSRRQLFPHPRPANHSFSFDQRRPPEALRAAIATAFFWPTSTTSRLPRVTPV